MILVLITAYGTDALEEEVHRLGIGYITKPFEPSRLVQTIHGLVRGEETSGGTENASRLLF
jgi:DNA-binding response OmpR family regulator